MKIWRHAAFLIVMAIAIGGFMNIAAAAERKQAVGPTSFGDDLAFLKKYTRVITLSDSAGHAQVAVVPAYQGRVMTSTANGAGGTSFGWVNRELIASRQIQPHINVYGGEDRIWLGPEGGQFALFFAPGAPFDLEHWQTPAPIDTEPFEVLQSDASRAVFHRAFRLTNYSKTTFDIDITREVRLLGPDAVRSKLGIAVPDGVRTVAFESINTVRNKGAAAWQKQTGLLSIWILGMLNASPASVIVIPYRTGPQAKLGPIVNDAYFGKVPADRLRVKDGVLLFRADANYRAKIGISPARSKPLFGSYDAANHVLTIVQYTKPANARDYVNSMWKIQKDPFGGDVVNSYNDGPSAPGAKQMGHFYELETSSPALALATDQTATHTHTTIHLQGPESALNEVSRRLLGVGLDEIRDSAKE